MFRSGVGFLALFGAGWWFLGIGGFGATAGVIGAVAGCAVAAALMYAAWRLLPVSAGGPLPPAKRRRFAQVNGVQWLLIAVVAVGCGRAGAPELIPPLIALVVGLHFVPLASAFDQPRLRLPAALLCLVGAAGLVLALTGGSAEGVRAVVGLGSAVSLWVTAVLTVRADRTAHTTVPGAGAGTG
ncbi:hypothetical protein [Streptomyces sp. t39]|uniref:hypothetical protein n=1 Tax=Streptomyces sp. t39 TaxID=1828156 RepID=UPI0011CD7AD7|nr:hypothetical protein [Streptomyces sp. t39]TXS57555.1 hypothetical protein EAO77_16955 [Streptomyces sp. t39]